jgi:signal transduction histidine kinase
VGGLVASAAALAGAFLGAVWVAAGPVVRRLRGLTAAVGQAAAAHYARPLEVAGRDEIAALARAFNDAAAEVRDHVARVEAREQTLRSFVANTTHDVMLPLTVLQGYLAALRQSSQEGRCDADVVQSASEEAHYLASLVHNLGAAAKLEAGEPHVERHAVNLNALVERAAGRHRPIAAPRDIEVNTAVPERQLVATGDVTLIEQAVSNLIHNAVRYNQPGGHVAVVLEPAASADGSGDNGRFRLRVFDDGPGVPEELYGRLAEPHYRADDARTRSPGGQGLGLSIARQVADRHGFTMDIRRSEAGGLEVELAGDLA